MQLSILQATSIGWGDAACGGNGKQYEAGGGLSKKVESLPGLFIITFCVVREVKKGIKIMIIVLIIIRYLVAASANMVPANH